MNSGTSARKALLHSLFSTEHLCRGNGIICNHTGEASFCLSLCSQLSYLPSSPVRWSTKAAHTTTKTRHRNRYRNCHRSEYRSRYAWNGLGIVIEGVSLLCCQCILEMGAGTRDVVDALLASFAKVGGPLLLGSCLRNLAGRWCTADHDGSRQRRHASA
jgi:hypothetical protein